MVVVFTFAIAVSVAEGYEDRIITFHKKYCGPGGKVGLAAINVNLIKEDLLPRMEERAKEKGFLFPYIFDATQIARDYGAVYTPEFFILNKERKIAYMGAMDDRIMEKDVKDNYLETALASILKGEKAKVSETLGRGCGFDSSSEEGLNRHHAPRDAVPSRRSSHAYSLLLPLYGGAGYRLSFHE